MLSVKLNMLQFIASIFSTAGFTVTCICVYRQITRRATMATAMDKSSYVGGLVNEAVVYEVSHYDHAQTVTVSG